MSEENSPKPEKGHIERPDINKGHDINRSYEELSHPNTDRSIKEGYQPITDVSSNPPSGGSGVPDKSED
ncbi:hypothetical protein NAF17_16880 [Mucilaginibacter sp. RB4R14]|uniref:hypothetical protein n=1 Tax=Mucilaginibacter aurantiaciroseus TaxID=2949308 RepID=UPI0020906204|nr:hypothetical protein [Mucilaginibacter aurantiaciroseus]MCO5937223.1 hypothetical protein [Mucilaginibacter aurantiaciroseus]